MSHRLLKSILSCLFLVCAFGAAPTHAATPHKKKHARARKTVSNDAAARQKTIVLPVRYLRGYRLINMLRMFLTRREQKFTNLRYSPALHKLLIQSTPEILQRLKKASAQLDQPQAQFRLRLFFVAKLDKAPQKPLAHKALHTRLKRHFPRAAGFALLSSLVVRATNHDETELKVSQGNTVSSPSLKFVLHQAPSPKAAIQLHLKIARHQSFRSVSRAGTNTQFIVSSLLKTKLSLRPGVVTLVGHCPLRDHRFRGRFGRALVLVKVQRLSAPQRLGSLGKKAIQGVIRAQQNHFKRCYEIALQKQPNLQGRVIFSFVITPHGKVTKLRVKTSSLRHKRVEACLQGRFAAMQFPKPHGGGIVRVTYPLYFSPK